MGTERHVARQRLVERLMGKLVREYPDWRVTKHTLQSGREVMMIEFADADGRFETGLPGEFVSLLADFEGDDADQ